MGAFEKGRKHWVVTAQYIGPDRRDGERKDAEQVPLISVPNPVQIKTSGKGRGLDQAIQITSRLVRVNYKIRQAAHLNYLANQIALAHDGEPIDYLVTELKETAESLTIWFSKELQHPKIISSLSQVNALSMQLLNNMPDAESFIGKLVDLCAELKSEVAMALAGAGSKSA